MGIIIEEEDVEGEEEAEEEDKEGRKNLVQADWRIR
jgi:hypothetical protein